MLQPGIDRPPGVLASIMYPHLARTAFVALVALGTPIARADVYTWTDASGRLNVSNLAPPDGVQVDSVIREEAPKVSPAAAAAREAAHNAQLQALNERVAQLQDEVDRAKQAPAQLPPVVYHAAPPAPPAPPVQVTVNVMPAPPAESNAPDYVGYPNGPLPGFPYPGYPGLPYDYCEPTIFGCPAFGYPAGIVVLSAPHAHHFKHGGAVHGRSKFPAMRPLPARSGPLRR